MPADIITLPSPPRRVLPAGQGAMMFELEDEVAVVKAGYDLLTRVCAPEQPGERLLWPAGLDRCVMLGHSGIVKVYAEGKVIARHPGLFQDDDELLNTASVGPDRTALLLGRMVGDPLLLPTPEYRFLILKNTVQPAAAPKLVLKRKPLGWGVHVTGSRILVLTSGAGGEKLLAVPFEAGEAQELAFPPELAGKKSLGMAVEGVRGELALAVRGSKGGELALLENPGGKTARYTALTPTGPAVDQPAWSPDGRRVCFRLQTGQGHALAVITLQTKLPRTLGAWQEGDEVVWLDDSTLARVRWDTVERLSLAL